MGIAYVGGAFRAFGLGEGERVFATSKFFFAYGLEHALLAPLAAGATSILSAEWPSAESVIDTVARHRVTALFSVPTLYRRMLAEPAERLAALRGVRRFVSAGEPLSPQLVEQWRAASGGELLNLYGPTSAGATTLANVEGLVEHARSVTIREES